jgi:xylose isomerase
MRTYLLLKEKAERMREDPEIQAAMAAAKSDRLSEPTGSLADVRSSTPDEEALAAQGYAHERLDQLVTDLLLGAR